MDLLIQLADANVKILDRMLADVGPGEMCRQFAGVPNHPAWHVGHLAMVRAAVARMLGADTERELPKAAFDPFARGSVPVGDAAAYPDKDDLLKMFRTAHRAAIDALRQAGPTTLDKPHAMGPIFQELFPTTRHMVHNMLTTHDGLHIGQLGTWRSAAGLPRVL